MACAPPPGLACAERACPSLGWQGLGKTLQTIAVVAHMAHARKLAGAALVVCPLSVFSTWCAELKRWAPSLRVVKLHSSDPAERERLRGRVLEEVGGYDVVVTTYEMLKSAAMRPVLVQKLHWRLLVLDEGHVLKNAETEISQTVRQRPPRRTPSLRCCQPPSSPQP